MYVKVDHFVAKKRFLKDGVFLDPKSSERHLLFLKYLMNVLVYLVVLQGFVWVGNWLTFLYQSVV